MTIFSTASDKNKPPSSLCLNLVFGNRMVWTGLYIKDLIWAVIKNPEIQKKRLSGLKPTPQPPRSVPTCGTCDTVPADSAIFTAENNDALGGYFSWRKSR